MMNPDACCEAHGLVRLPSPPSPSNNLLPAQQPPSRLPGFVVLVAAIILVLVWAAVARTGSGDAGAEPRLERAATDVARLIDSGDTAAVAGVVETARVEAGCGHVHPFVFPAPQAAPSGGVGGVSAGLSQQQDPETTVAGMVRDQQRPDVIATALASAGRQVVVVAGWSCV